MMNGAAIGYQDHVAQLRGDSSLGYRKKQMHSSHGDNPVDRKAMSYHSSRPFVVGNPTDISEPRKSLNSDRRSSDSYGRRDFSREPLDLPVPRFVIDENYVFDGPLCGEVAKELDLDTRIQLLIKSNALSGVLPIFSEFKESDDSNLSENSLKRQRIKEKRRSSETRHSYVLEDDPDKPLSRAPSPFLSRATYLFWFNKAIEIKEQAKEQEKALLEIASKKLVGNPQSQQTKPVETTPIKSEPPKPISSCMFSSLLDELCKELKEVVKEEFINNMIESTALKVLDDLLESKEESCLNLREGGADAGVSSVRHDGSLCPSSETLTARSSISQDPQSGRNHEEDVTVEKHTVEEEGSAKLNNLCSPETEGAKKADKDQEESGEVNLKVAPDLESTNEKDSSSSILFGNQDSNASAGVSTVSGIESAVAS